MHLYQLSDYAPQPTFSHSLKVLKQVHPDTRISVCAIQVMDDLITDMFHKLALEAKNLAKYRKKKKQ